VPDPPLSVQKPKLEPFVPKPIRGEKNDKFKKELLRKRRTYIRYFEKNLPLVNDKLSRIAEVRKLKDFAISERKFLREKKVMEGRQLVDEFLHRSHRTHALDPSEYYRIRMHELKTRKDGATPVGKLTKKSKKYVERYKKRLTIKTLKEKERRLAAEHEWLLKIEDWQTKYGTPSTKIMYALPLAVLARSRKAPLQRSNAMRGKGKKGKEKAPVRSFDEIRKDYDRINEYKNRKRRGNPFL